MASAAPRTRPFISSPHPPPTYRPSSPASSRGIRAVTRGQGEGQSAATAASTRKSTSTRSRSCSSPSRAPASPATSSARTSSTASISRPAPPSPRMTRASTSLSMTASPRASAAGRGQPGNGVLSGEDRRARVLLARSACAAPSRARQHIGGRAEAAPPRPRPVSPPSGRVPRPGQLRRTIVRRSRARPSCGRGLG